MFYTNIHNDILLNLTLQNNEYKKKVTIRFIEIQYFEQYNDLPEEGTLIYLKHRENPILVIETLDSILKNLESII